MARPCLAPILVPSASGSDEFLPLVEELVPAPRPEDAFRRMCRLPHCLFLDSAVHHPTLGRYSFVAADPFDFIRLATVAGSRDHGRHGHDCVAVRLSPPSPHATPTTSTETAVALANGPLPASGSPDALDHLAQRMAGLRTQRLAGLPPFQGGAAGLFGYDLGATLETLPRPRIDEFHLPLLAVGLYDVVVAMDHVERRAWIVSQGLPELDPGRRRHRAQQRLDEVRAWLAASHIVTPSPQPPQPPPIAAAELAPQFPVDGRPGLSSNFSKAEYLQTVRRAIDYIYAGDVFQVNLAQRLLSPAQCDAPSLYLRLRRRDPAPFAGYFDLGDFQIVSASPERFLRLSAGQVETRPIKGTRPRSGEPEADRRAEIELRRSEKDRAENVMIVDLLRNDLSRVCRSESVQVGQLCRVETYHHVLHLVSAVHGRLRDGCTPIDLLRATFPGGSITGAPKIRAMELIAELEPTARGAYCGSMGYVGFDDSMDLSILIRTITAGRGWWQAPVGGGIVAQSVPEREYEETWHKAEGLIRAMQ